MSTLLITGISGTLGRALCDLFRDRYNLVGLHRNEHSTHLVRAWAEADLACIRDYESIDRVFAKYRPDYVIHTAAMKKVDDIEKFPMEGVKTNVLGTENVCRAADKYNVKKLVFTNTDKIGGGGCVLSYGAQKLLAGNICMTWNERSNTIFSQTVYGNVIGSKSSALGLFLERARQGLPIKLTSEEATRFFFTIEEAAQLVESALDLSEGGEKFVPVIHSYFVKDLVKAVGLYLGKSVDYEVTGFRCVEKTHEGLFTEEEASRTWHVKDILANNLLVVLPRDTVGQPSFVDIKYNGPALTSDLPICLDPNLDNLVKMIERCDAKA